MTLNNYALMKNTLPIYGSTNNKKLKEGLIPIGIFFGATELYKYEIMHPICRSSVWVWPIYVL